MDLKVQITQLINRKEFCNNQNAHKYSRSLEQKDQKASDAFESNIYANSWDALGRDHDKNKFIKKSQSRAIIKIIPINVSAASLS